MIGSLANVDVARDKEEDAVCMEDAEVKVSTGRAAAQYEAIVKFGACRASGVTMVEVGRDSVCIWGFSSSVARRLGVGL
jgi:hypothetical protein